MRLTDFLNDLDRPIAYYPALTEITGGVKETILLCQLIYWTGKQHDSEGWIYKTQKEILEETGLSRKEQETARRHLRDKGFVEEKFTGVPRKLYFRVNLDAINEAWENLHNVRIGHSIMPDSDIQECTNRASNNAPFVQANINTENTTEITTKKKTHMCVYPDEFELWWKEYPRHVDKRAACNKWKARIKEGYSPTQLLEAAKAYADKCRKEGREERYIKHPATFLGPNKPFEEYLTPKNEEPQVDGFLRYIQLQQQAWEKANS